MLHKTVKSALCATLLAATLTSVARAQDASALAPAAQPFLHPLFSENAVLQRDRPLTIWGWAQPGESVVVKFDGLTQTVRAGQDGRWSAPLAPHGAGGPHSLVVAGARPGEYAARKNLLFGDVWLCSGQSNMEFSLSGINDAATEIAAANYPNIRLLHVPNNVQPEPVDTFQNASWQLCTPQTVGSFSAVGYFFGRKLNQDLNVPIGLIESNWGGTPARSWTSKSALQTLPAFADQIAALDQTLDASIPMEQRMATWWQSDPGTRANWQNPDLDDSGWQTVDLPGAWESNGFPNYDGVMWFRRTIEVPASAAGRDLTLNLSAIDDRDTTYWNGAVIGADDAPNAPRTYTVPGAQVKAGRNVLAVRVLDTGGGGGFTGTANAMTLVGGDFQTSVAGAWKTKPGASLGEMPALAQIEINQNSPTALYNGMIAPLLPGQIKGAIWYQGESDADRTTDAIRYRDLLPTMIRDWRGRFGTPLPFYIVQLANFRQPTDAPDGGNDVWPFLREAQSLTAKNLPDTGIATITDIGDAGDIHPKNKQDVGLRLALAALHQTYGENIEYSGPTLQSVTPKNGALQLKFDHAQGLTLKGEANRVFAIAGADRQFFWATPQINGNTVTLQNVEVSAPRFARFGWSDNPRANLYNGAGLPASPFRTDGDAK